MSLLEQYEAHLEAKRKPKSLLELVQEKMGRQKESPPSTESKLLNLVESNRKKYTLNEEVFESFKSTHREHQSTAVYNCQQHEKGQVTVPTGTGKTRIQIHLHVEDMIQKTKQEQTGVYVIGAHRLLLCKQLMDELRDLCFRVKLPVNILYIGSARHDDKPVFEKYFNEGLDADNFESFYTTRSPEVEEFYEKTKKANRHLIVVSTYHSFNKLVAIDEIDICTFDEAHTTIADDFNANIEVVLPRIKRSYYFTATRKTNGEDGGMNDEKMYGEVIYGVSPRRMIEQGEITMPRIHIMKLEDDTKELVNTSNEKMLVKTVIEGFEEHTVKLREDSAEPEKIAPKLLVSCKGSDELKAIQNNLAFQAWCQDNDVKVYSFSSKYGAYEDFETENNRNKVYESMRDLKDTDKCILLHIDILTEGIDLPSITAVMLLRHLNVAKLLQTLGRALRLLKDDRKRLYAGEILPHERDKYIKPYAYILLPMHFETLDASSEMMKDMLQRIIGEYGLPMEEFLPLEEFAASKFEYLDPVTDIHELRRREKDYPLIHVIQDFVMDKFKDQLPEDREQRYNAITELLNELKEEEANA